MSNKNLTVDLKARPDVDGRTFYVGKLKFPGTIDCKEGVVFLIFVSDTGEEQIQIAPLNSKDDLKDD
jgi:hypothetical protein